MKKKQTAVDYLVKELSAILGHLETKPMQDLLMIDAINKAKQIEEEQIIDGDILWVYDYETELDFTKQDYDKKLLMDFTPKIYEWIMKPPFNLEHAQHGLACEKFGDVRTDFLKKRSLGN